MSPSNAKQRKDVFRAAANGPKPKRPPPVSVRLTVEEYDRLRRLAGAMSMAAYIRLKVFGEEEIAPHRKAYIRKQYSPSSELAMIGHILGGLGQSEIASNLSDLAKAARVGALPVTPELERTLQTSCASIEEMRLRLMSALRVKAE